MAADFSQALRAARAFVRAVQASGIRLDAAYLYGSYAKGHAHVDSDIDVALVSPDFSGWVDDLDKIRPALLNRDPRIEAVRFRPDTFRDENPLAWEVKTTGISLVNPGKAAKRRAPSNRRKRARPASASRRRHA